MSSTVPRGGLRPCTSDSAKPRLLCAAFAADNPAHSRIVAQALAVVHILGSGKATKYRLPEQPAQCVPTILATACVGQNVACHLGQTEYVVRRSPGSRETGASNGGRNPAEQRPIPIHPLGAPW